MTSFKDFYNYFDKNKEPLLQTCAIYGHNITGLFNEQGEMTWNGLVHVAFQHLKNRIEDIEEKYPARQLDGTEIERLALGWELEETTPPAPAARSEDYIETRNLSLKRKSEYYAYRDKQRLI